MTVGTIPSHGIQYCQRCSTILIIKKRVSLPNMLNLVIVRNNVILNNNNSQNYESLLYRQKMSKRSSRTRSQNNFKNINKQKQIKESKQKVVQPQTYEFVNKKYSSHLKCKICHELMKNPTRLYTCGHTFCLDCIETTVCQICDKKIVVKQKDLIAIGMINELKVKCLNQGCPFNGSYEEYLHDHGKNCKLKDGMDNWMLKMQALMQDFSTCKMKETKENDLEAKSYGLTLSQSLHQQKQNERSVKSINYECKQKKDEQQMSSKRGQHMRQYIAEQQLLQKRLMKEF